MRERAHQRAYPPSQLELLRLVVSFPAHSFHTKLSQQGQSSDFSTIDYREWWNGGCRVLIMGLMFMLSTHHYWLDIPTHGIKGPTR